MFLFIMSDRGAIIKYHCVELILIKVMRDILVLSSGIQFLQ